MAADESAQVVSVPLAELRPREWAQLTFGFLWRGVAWWLMAAVLGTAVSYAVAIGVSSALGGTLSSEGYGGLAVPLTIVPGLLVTVVASRWFVRLVLTGRYGALRLAVVRDQPYAVAAERVV